MTKSTDLLSAITRARRSTSGAALRLNSCRSEASSSPCGGAPARTILKYSDLRNRVQNSRSVILPVRTLSWKARLTWGRSAKMRCIFSCVSVAVTLSPSPARWPWIPAISALSIPVRWFAPALATAPESRCRLDAQNSSSVIVAESSVPSRLCLDPMTSVPCMSARSLLDSRSAWRAARSAAEVTGSWSDPPPPSASACALRALMISVSAALMASLSASRSDSASGKESTSALGFCPGLGSPTTRRSDGVFDPGLLR